MISIHFTGDLIRYDGSDTDCYGEATETGDGYTLQSGWVDIDWSRFEVYAERDDVRPDTHTEQDGPVIEWIADTLVNRLGVIELESSNGRTVYAAEDEQDYITGDRITYAAHIDAPENLTAAALALLGHRVQVERAARWAMG